MIFLASNFWQKIISWDQQLFKKINSEWTNPLFDAVMPFLRNSLNWAPLYLFFLIFILMNFKKKGLWWIVFFISTVAMTDMTGNYVFKHGFERLRPCNDPLFFDQVRLLIDHCGAGYSFISNHAANHFGMAAFFLGFFPAFIQELGMAGYILGCFDRLRTGLCWGALPPGCFWRSFTGTFIWHYYGILIQQAVRICYLR